MKKKAVIALSLIVILLLTYFVPIRIAREDSIPLYGNFDIGSECMGGHEIFLLLERDRCYMNCPGHNDKKEFGMIVRSKDAVVIYSPDGVTPWARIEYRRSEHLISYTDGGYPKLLEQVVNPWRLRLPYYLSKDH